MTVIFDLHVHSNASDGVLSPEEVISEAVLRGLRGIALTDHDTIDGLQAAQEYIQQHNLNLMFINGIEMNCEFRGKEVHILGYFIQPEDQTLRHRLIEIRMLRHQRAESMVEKLQHLGISIDFARVKEYAKGDLIGRPHIARALIEGGYSDSIEDAFYKYLGSGKPAYVPRYKFLPDEAIALVKKCGGIPVLAHPGLINDADIVDEVIAMGIEGLEVYYPQHSQDQTEGFKKICLKNHLLMTGGSDFHGPGSSENRNLLGGSGIQEEDMNQLLNEYQRRIRANNHK
jgi:predicted metal-dependent phosphoesterase TrpH